MQQFNKGISNLLAILFHPLFIIIYVIYLFLRINPYLFPYRNEKIFDIILIKVLFIAVIIPGISILTMYGTGLVSSLKLEEKTERIGPLMVTAIAYLWLFLNIRTHNAIPTIFSAFVLGALISVCLAFFINNFHKISLHAVGMGGLLIAICGLITSNGRAYSHFNIFDIYNLTIHNLFLMSLIIITLGAVLTSRLYLKAHTLQDVMGGLLVGVIGQIIALKVL